MSTQTTEAPSTRNPRSFHVVTKHIGSACNLGCTYCYYRDKENILPDKTIGGRMDDELLEEFIHQYITDQDADSVTFNWHGGEPALLGIDFYRKILELEKKYADGKHIENDFQTNGVLLDDSWCEFLKENNFYVGLSIDGPKQLHDVYRKGKDGEPTFDRFYHAARLLQKYEIPFNPLTVVNAVNAKHPEEVYRFLTEDLGCTRLQWLPCVEPKDFRTVAPGTAPVDQLPILGSPAAKPGNSNSVVTDWSVDPDDWGEFLCQTFYLWMKNGLGTVVVNWFESLVGQWMGKPANICSLAGVCGRSLVTIEKDGSIYSCDRFVYPEYKLGNLRDGGIQLVDLVYSEKQRAFGCNKHIGLPNYCKQCRYLFVCHGECPKNRLIKTPDGQPGLNYLCSGIKRFMTYAEPYFQQIIEKLPVSVLVNRILTAELKEKRIPHVEG
jgi:uncharacterized protein